MSYHSDPTSLKGPIDSSRSLSLLLLRPSRCNRGWSESAREMFTNTASYWNVALPLCLCTPPACQPTRLCDAVGINHPGKPEKS